MPLSSSVSPKTRLWLVLILVLTSLVYAGSLRNGFVLDDSVMIVRNDLIRSWENLPKLFTKSYLTPMNDWNGRGRIAGSGEITYRPLVTLSYFLDYHVWKLAPFGHHLTNLFLHLLCVFTLFLLARAILKDDPAALVASLLFAVHPVNSEAVAVITNRKEMMSFLLYASSFLLFLKKDRENPGGKTMFSPGSLFCFLLALLTKEMTVTLPAMLFLYDHLFVYRGDLKAQGHNAVRRYGPYVLVLLVYGVFWFLFRGGVADVYKACPYPGGSFYTNLCTMTRIVALYIRWLFLPLHLHATLVGLAAFPPSYSFLEPGVLKSAALILGLLVPAFVFRKRSPVFSFSVLWFFVLLLPVLNIFLPLHNILACRYLYLPSVPFSLGAAWALTRLLNYRGRLVSTAFLKGLAGIFLAGLVLFYAGITISRLPVWNDNFSLSFEFVKNYPLEPVTHMNLAGELRSRGFLGDALRECKATIALNPKLPFGYNELGVTLLGAGRPEQAIHVLRQALLVKPDFLFAYCNLGLSYQALGRWEEAREAWRAAARLAPGNAAIRTALQEAESRR